MLQLQFLKLLKQSNTSAKEYNQREHAFNGFNEIYERIYEKLARSWDQ